MPIVEGARFRRGQGRLFLGLLGAALLALIASDVLNGAWGVHAGNANSQGMNTSGPSFFRTIYRLS